MTDPPAASETHGPVLPALSTRVMAAGLLFVSVLLLYAPALRFDFIVFDDTEYVTENSRVLGGLSLENLRWAFTAYHAANWHPLTWVSHMADVSVFGVNPAGHHAVSVVLHAANAVFVLLSLTVMTRRFWPSLAVAAVFALHPLRVESVAWVSERKDVLCAFFELLAIAAYLRYVRTMSTGNYLLTALMFIFALLAKPMAITLPLVLLILDFWPLRRVHSPRFLVLEKVPLLLLSGASAVVTYLAQSAGAATKSLDAYPLWSRITNAAYACVIYLVQLVWPANLSPFYPHPIAPQPMYLFIPATVLLLVLGIVCVTLRRNRPYALAGFLWYLVMLAPVIGIVQVGKQSHADRYTYLPLIGITIALVFAIADLMTTRSRIRAATVAAVLLIGAFAVTARTQMMHWRDSVALFTHAIEVNPDNWLAHLNLGKALCQQNRREEGLRHFDRAIELVPDYVLAHFNRGAALTTLGRLDEAVAAYRKAIEYNPKYVPALFNCASVLFEQGDVQGSIEQYEAVVQLQPGNLDALVNLGVAHAAAKNYDRAQALLTRALDFAPDDLDATYNLGRVFVETGQFENALPLLEGYVAKYPNDLDAAVAYAQTLLETGNRIEAEAQLRRVLQSSPRHDGARRALNALLGGQTN